MDLGLRGKVAIVTGGARGIGRSIGEGFVTEGAHVVIGDILFDAAQELAATSSRKGGKVLAVKTDVRSKADVDNLVETTVKEFGRIDILVNAAGIVRESLLANIEEDEWQ
jgi:3-oxoacyl-[acyl-carrier protein] reductase